MDHRSIDSVQIFVADFHFRASGLVWPDALSGQCTLLQLKFEISTESDVWRLDPNLCPGHYTLPSQCLLHRKAFCTSFCGPGLDQKLTNPSFGTSWNNKLAFCIRSTLSWKIRASSKRHNDVFFPDSLPSKVTNARIEWFALIKCRSGKNNFVLLRVIRFKFSRYWPFLLKVALPLLFRPYFTVL